MSTLQNDYWKYFSSRDNNECCKNRSSYFKNKFGVKEHDKVLRKQQSLELRLKKLFPNEDIIEKYFALHYRTDFTFQKHMLVIEIGEKGHVDRDPGYEKKNKNKKN